MNLFSFIYSFAIFISFLTGIILTELCRSVAIQLNILDHPQGRKSHIEPTPLLGGVGIFASFHISLFIIFLLYLFSKDFREALPGSSIIDFLGAGSFQKVLGIVGGSVVIFILGLIDDIKSLRPGIKLAGQILASLILVFSGIRIEMFYFSHWLLSSLITIAWIVLLTNSLNLLDNMDGLCAGISFISAIAFFLCIQPYDEFLIRLFLMIFAGSVAGFLFHNINPARIFMGDAGSMFCGFFLSTIGVLGTFHLEGTPSRVAILAPVVILSVPLFDTFSVIYLRWRSGQPIMLGDKRHFSHRLVELGMTSKQAVEFIWLVGIITCIGALFLPMLNFNFSVLIILQILGIYILIVLLMNAQKNTNGK